ncbi:DUF1700 domain-containing protein [Clostridium estertheticum]|uniref:DUF1700 domain-containing protein n=1 Tax=Clostridium estertheticum TaxID=238834 RepID=UPI001C7E17C4|nr:DUF1700 domain-containing protein [Clostridium estertheticum]MBX4266126.1 DUF1700 domain-containing protein [Clostridium estertheticum]WLC87932.1 DUF1700 domain-containing protein [Clostridium estertheticum]
MDMNNYLESLKDKIGNLPEGYKREILKDYENHFQEGLLVGKTENNIACELGEVDFIAKNIIAEYCIEHSEKVTAVKHTLKAIYAVKRVGVGTLNLLIGTPFVISIVVFVISLYILDVLLLLTPVFLILNLISPNLPINFGVNILMVKILIVLVFGVSGYLLYKILKKWSAKFFSWVFRYIIRSIKFQVLN